MRRPLALLLAAALCAAATAADEPVVSDHGVDNGVEELDGWKIIPAPDIPIQQYTGDWAPAQVFELQRPANSAARIGRMLTSCSCLRASADKKDFGAGERVLITVRNVKPTPKGGATYMIFVQAADPGTGQDRTLVLYARFESGETPLK